MTVYYKYPASSPAWCSSVVGLKILISIDMSMTRSKLHLGSLCDLMCILVTAIIRWPLLKPGSILANWDGWCVKPGLDSLILRTISLVYCLFAYGVRSPEENIWVDNISVITTNNSGADIGKLMLNILYNCEYCVSMCYVEG